MYKILLVDDSDDLREEVADLLSADDWDILQAENGLDGLEKYKASPDIDIVLSDLELPKMMGFDMIRKIRELPDGDRPVICLMSAHDDELIAKKIKNLNITARIFKPCPPNISAILLNMCNGKLKPKGEVK